MLGVRFLIYAVSIVFSGVSLLAVFAIRPMWFGVLLTEGNINYREFLVNETAVVVTLLILFSAFMFCATLLHWLLWRPLVKAEYRRIIRELKEPFKDIPEPKLEKNLTYQQHWNARKSQPSTSLRHNDGKLQS